MDNTKKFGRNTTCKWCGEELILTNNGWIHKSDGKIYKTKIINGEEADDHCALPIF